VGSTISRYENGIHQSKPGLQKLFAKVLELPLAYFHTEDDEEALRIATACRSEKPLQKLSEIKSRLEKQKRKKRK
jgi:hypothetical protein